MELAASGLGSCLTASHECRDSWRKAEFKPYNFHALGAPPPSGHLHPLLKVRHPAGHRHSCSAYVAAEPHIAPSVPMSVWMASIIAFAVRLMLFRCQLRAEQVRSAFRTIFMQMGFAEMPTNSFVESRCYFAARATPLPVAIAHRSL